MSWSIESRQLLCTSLQTRNSSPHLWLVSCCHARRGVVAVALRTFKEGAIHVVASNRYRETRGVHWPVRSRYMRAARGDPEMVMPRGLCCNGRCQLSQVGTHGQVLPYLVVNAEDHTGRPHAK